MSGNFFSIQFFNFQSRLDQRGCRQNEIQCHFRFQDHKLHQTTIGSFLHVVFYNNLILVGTKLGQGVNKVLCNLQKFGLLPDSKIDSRHQSEFFVLI